MKQLCPLVLIIILQHLTKALAVVSVGLGNETDHVALLAIKSQLIDHPYGILSSWNHSRHHCSWEGVTCGRENNRVIGLDLSSRGLGGTISPFIGNLSFLKHMLFYNNSLHGQIPFQISCLHRLESLEVHNNTLVGKIPANLTRNLQFLSLEHNKLEGNLPNDLGALVNLKRLYVSNNKFNGPLFNIISNVTSLEEISIECNKFIGTIPDSIGRLRNLTLLAVGQNQFSGILPSSLFNLSSLRNLELIDNQFHGELPENIGLTLPGLKYLNIGLNNLSGRVPISISNLTSLESLDLGDNGFTGRVSHDFGRLRNLGSLILWGNSLTGDISFVSSLVNCTKLSLVSIGRNQFTGCLPVFIGNLSTSLVWLDVEQCQLHGPIPLGVTNLINLVHLWMNDNQFTGSLPRDIGMLYKLEYVDLSYNRLSGTIPNSLGNLSRTGKLYLDHNNLQGNVPPSIGSLNYLQFLDLSSNDLNGTLVREFFEGSCRFIYLNLSHNHLEGSLPLESNNQINLVEFYVSENKFSGVIPSSLGGCSSLVNLNMQGNFFNGLIPPSFASLGSLYSLDLSRNNLTGPVPQFFSKFPLVSLNLSYNNFEGVVPTTGVFSNISVISVVGNKDLCGGVPDLHLPRCMLQKERKKRRLLGALKVAIPVICALLVGILIITTLLCLTRYRKKRKSDSSVFEIKEAFSRVSYNMLLKATDGFSSAKLLGSGNFGSVFEGVLDGNAVAVKIMNLQTRGAYKSFTAECDVLKNIHHRNLVPIITACSSIDFQGNDFKALVYEFMPNGNLDKWLHEDGNLTLLQRLEIATDVAEALNYLHSECEISVVHCDLKPSNVLIDNDMVAHVGDFGLAMFLTQPQHSNQSSSIGIRGTVGYAAPEYGLGSEVSPEADVYSYGILLLELMTGRRPTDDMFKEDFNLHMYAEAALPDQILQIVDPKLQIFETTKEIDSKRAVEDTVQRRMECIVSMVDVGVACSKYSPHERMKIADAISMLRKARDNLLNARHLRRFPLHSSV